MTQSLRPRTAAALSDWILRQLDAYALAASTARMEQRSHGSISLAIAASAVGLELLASAIPAPAKIVYTPANQSVTQNVPLDLNRDGINDFYFEEIFVARSSQTLGFVSLAITPYGTNRIEGNSPSAFALPAGARIGPGRPFPSHFDGFMAKSVFSKPPKFSGKWANGGKGVKNRYLGLKFRINGKTHYGWARVNLRMPGVFGTLTGYAYETIPNKGIIAGKTKVAEVATLQPASLGRLALGSVRP